MTATAALGDNRKIGVGQIPDERLRTVEWRDLLCLTRGEVVCFFFLTGLRQVHNAYHRALGLGRWPTDLTMFALSVGMMSAMHAIQATHLHHHRYCLNAEDVEGGAARHAWWRALLSGPAFALHLHRKGWMLAGPRARRWIFAEVAAIGVTGCPAAWIAWHRTTRISRSID